MLYNKKQTIRCAKQYLLNIIWWCSKLELLIDDKFGKFVEIEDQAMRMAKF